MDGFLQGGLVVKRFSGIGNEDGGDHERVSDDEDGARGIPGTVASCLEGAADASAGETGCIGFLLDELLAGELFHHTALAIVLHEAIVLLGRAFGQGLEPVGAMGGTELHGPFLHAFGKKTGYKGDNFAKGERRSNYKNDQRFDKSRRNFEQAPNNDAEKLSSMSFDERMKVYREKYGQNAGGTAAPAGDRPNRGKPNSQNGGKKYNGNKNRYGDKPQNGGAYKGKNNRNYDKSGKNYAKPNQTYAKNENAAKPKPAENQQPAKKGFLAKLKGIFGKK